MVWGGMLQTCGAFWEARRVDLLWGPGLGLQLPLLALFCRERARNRPAGVLVGGLFAVARFLLEADCGVFVESWWRIDG
jgi:hypothetical protein